jgi:peroxiredoxin
MLRWSRQLGYGQEAAPFALPDTNGEIRTLDEFGESPALLVAFICNHCPVVLHMLDGLCRFALEYNPSQLQVVAISSNDPADYPEDSYEHMKAFARDRALPFPYLYDEDQNVALSYGAICTPDFFLYGIDRRLFYTGQFDSSRPKLPHPPVPGAPIQHTDMPVTGDDMRAAVDSLLAGKPAPQPQIPSAGCSIKWRPGKDPSWA